MLSEYVRDGALDYAQAIRVVEDIFFNTSNKLYDLQLHLKRLATKFPNRANSPTDLEVLGDFLKTHSDVKHLRLQYIDYTGTPRLRVIPIKRALSVLTGKIHGRNRYLSVGITKASLGHLQNHALVAGVDGTGEYILKAVLSSLKAGPTAQFASVQGEFRDKGDKEVILCPRSILRRAVDRAKISGLGFLVGFEIEIVFLSEMSEDSKKRARFGPDSNSYGHAWNSAKAVQNHAKMLVDISESLARVGIDLEQWHAEVSTQVEIGGKLFDKYSINDYLPKSD